MSNLERALGGVSLLATLAAACAPAKSSTSSAPMPSEVSECKASTEGRYGVWTPSVDDAVAAMRALPPYCFSSPAAAEVAVRACAARLGKTTMTLGVAVEQGTCWASIVPAEWNGRRWITGHYIFEHEGQFGGSGAVVELRGGNASLVLQNEGLVSACDSPATMPAGAPADWASYPAELARLLCGFGK